MDLIRHQDNGAKGLRIAASVIVIIGWLALAFCVIAAIVNAEEIIFIVPILAGVGSLAVCYLLACVIRGFASLVEAAQLYWNLNTTVSEDDYPEE